MKTTLLTLIFAFQIIGYSFCQLEKKTISYSEFEDLIKTTTGDYIVFQNYIIEWDDAKDIIFESAETMVDEGSGRMTMVYKRILDSLIFPKKELWLHGCAFKSPPSFINWNFKVLSINGCRAEDFIRFENCKFNYLSIAYTTFEKLAIKNSVIEFTNYRDQQGLHLYNVQCSDDLFIVANDFKKNIGFDSTIRHGLEVFKQMSGDSFLEELDPLIKIHDCILADVYLRGNKFLKTEIASDTLVILGIIGTSVHNLTMSNSSIASLDLNHSTISQSTELDSLYITDFISLNKFDFRVDVFNVSWELLENANVCLRKSGKNYYGKTNVELSENVLYNDLMGTYAKLVNSYRDRGDIESANKCYIALKDLDTKRKKFLYETYGGGTNYLNYQMNNFLRYFALYGTSPVRSIQISWRVILLFACIYFFFYSSWDKIDRKFLVQKGSSLISYFNSDKTLEDFFHLKHKNEITSYEEFKENLKSNKGRIPLFFNLFLKPLYWMSAFKFKFFLALYSRVEMLKGTWSNISITRKGVVGFFTFFYVIFYIGYLLAFRGLNSIILSLNTFVTLGFGEIPVRGISKYVAIVEGTLGWILLSIFSVTLLSQIMQI